MVTSTSVTLRPSEAEGIGHKTVKNGTILENIKELTKTYGGFHKWGTPKKIGLYKFIMEHPIKVDDLGVLLFQETPYMCGALQHVGSTETAIRFSRQR